MKQLLKEVSAHIKKDYDSGFDTYTAMQSHPGWDIHRNIIGRIKLSIVKEMLSERFTRLSPTEKDSQQKAFFMLDEILNYLINPIERDIKKQKFNQGVNQAMGINPVTKEPLTGKDLNS